MQALCSKKSAPTLEESTRVTILFYRLIAAATHSRSFHEQFVNQHARGDLAPDCLAVPAASLQRQKQQLQLRLLRLLLFSNGFSCSYAAQPGAAKLRSGRRRRGGCRPGGGGGGAHHRRGAMIKFREGPAAGALKAREASAVRMAGCCCGGGSS